MLRHLSKVRHHTTKKLHGHLSNKVEPYKNWHDFKYHKHVHAGVLVMYLLSTFVIAMQFPGDALAALDQSTKTVTSQEDFEAGDYTEDIVVENDEIKLKSMDTLSNPNGGSWLYRRVITIDNTSGSEESDYQFEFTFDSQPIISAGKMQADGDDIRFTNSDGETELDYWLESGINTSSTKVWVQIPLLPGSTNKDIYIYYGNSSATSSSDPSSYESLDISFYAHNGSHITTSGVVKWNVITENTGNAYSSSTGKFIAPVDGIYYFTWGGIEYTSSTTSLLDLYLNGALYSSNSASVRYDGYTGYDAATSQATMKLNAGDEVSTYLRSGGIYQAYNHFSGHLVSADNTTPSFYVRNNGHYTSVSTDIKWNTTTHNTGNNYNSSTGKFTAPTNGIYHFAWGGMSSTAGTRARFQVRVNGSAYASNSSTVYSHSYSSRYDHGSHQATMPLNAGDQVSIYLVERGVYSNYGYFTGHRVSADTALSSFYAYNSSHHTTTGYVNFNTIKHNTGSDYNASTRKYTAPVDGVYDFSWGGIEYPSSTVARTYIYKNGATYSGSSAGQLRFDNTSSRYDGCSQQATMYLNAGDQIGIYRTAGGVYQTYGYFTGNLVDASPPSIDFTLGSESGASTSSASWTSDYDIDGEVIDLVWNGGWGTPNGLEADVNIVSDSSISFEARSSAVGGSNSADWSSWQTLGTIDSSGGTGDRTLQIPQASMPNNTNLPQGTYRYIQLRTNLNTSGMSPIVKEMRLIYLADNNAPTNPDTVNAWKDNTKNDVINDGDWAGSQAPYFEWSGEADNVGESGVEGYWVYFGTDGTADPMTAGTWQTSSNFEADIDDDDSGETFYLAISTQDFAENRYTNGSPNYYKVFTYKFDYTNPDAPAYVGVNPVGWATVNEFDFSWPDASDPMSNGDASGIEGYQYKLGESGDWSAVITDTFVNDLEAYQNGQNTFYVRALDNAGNISNNVIVNFFFNADAPAEPQNLAVDPPNAIVNTFTFTWDEPLNPNTPIKGYYYSLNATPTSTNSTYTTERTTGEIPAATQQGLNTFYVVAMDSTDNVNYANYAEVQFQCNTPAPGIPTSVEIFDTSNRDTQKYSVALSWEEPSYTGVGFAGYNIQRSDDGVNFTQVGSGSSTSYVDVGLESKLYYYRVISKDDSGNTSAPSSVVTITPTGRYTTPPELTHGPEITSKVSTATIRWFTDRGASSFVEIGENTLYGLTQGQFDFTTDHVVSLSNLSPDTLYHYRVKYVDQDGNIGYSADHTFKTEPAPRAKNVEVHDIRLDTATITWNTTAPAQCDLVFGQNSNYSSSINNVSGGFTTSHSARLTELTHSTNYHFAIRLTDLDGNEALSDDYAFETLKFPRISVIRAEPIKDASTATMKFTWETNVPATSIIEYTPEGGVLQEAVSSKLKTKHSITVNGLIDNTFYTVFIKGRDQFGNQAVSDLQRFKTDYDTRPPKLNEVSTESSISGVGLEARNQIVISWETDEPSTSQVEYGIGITGEIYTHKSQEDATLSTTHVVVISDLQPATTYHFRAVSRDASGNAGYSEDTYLLTDQASESVLTIIMRSLERAIGWLFNS